MSMDGILVLGNREGLVLWPYEQVAMLRDEPGTRRVMAVHCDGEAAHRPGRVSDYIGGPWVPAGDGTLLHPRHMRIRGGMAEMPGGWRIPWRGPKPKIVRARDEEVLAEIGVRPSDVLYVRVEGSTTRWVTDGGVIVMSRLSGPQAARMHGDLVRLGWTYVNRRRVRALLYAARKRLVMDDGARFDVHVRKKDALLAALGVPALDCVETAHPDEQPMYREELREWPMEIASAPGAWLRQTFGRDARRLLFNMVWQARQMRAAGRELPYGRTHRGFWYNPLLPVLRRAGLQAEAVPEEIVTLADWPKIGRIAIPDPPDKFSLLYLATEWLVGRYRLCTYQEIGFDDPRPDQRVIGARKPCIVLVVEKESMQRVAWEIVRRYGVSAMVLGGSPKLVHTEPMARALRGHGGKVLVISLVDFDYAGRDIAQAFVQHLERYGLRCEGLGHLVRAERFTSAELEAFSYPLRAANRNQAARARRFVQETGGIGGQARGIHANHLTDVERASRAFEAEMRSLETALTNW